MAGSACADVVVEEWKDIPGYEGTYEASNLGNIRYFKTKANLALCGRLKGFIVLNMFGDRKTGQVGTSKRYVHIIIALTFIPNPDNCKSVQHINGNTLDNRVENLMWIGKKKADEKKTKETIKKKWEDIKNVNNKSGFRGVSFEKARGKYRAKFEFNSKDYHLGYFATAEEAHNAINAKREELKTVVVEKPEKIKTGVVGVSFIESRKKFRAVVRVGIKRVSLGYFATIEEAKTAIEKKMAEMTA